MYDFTMNDKNKKIIYYLPKNENHEQSNKSTKI